MRQARLDKPSLALSRGPALEVADSRFPYIIVTAAPWLIFSCIFERERWRMGRRKCTINSEPIRVVGKERVELYNARGREKLNQSIAVWTGLKKETERDKTLLHVMVITTGSPSKA